MATRCGRAFKRRAVNRARIVPSASGRTAGNSQLISPAWSAPARRDQSPQVRPPSREHSRPQQSRVCCSAAASSVPPPAVPAATQEPQFARARFFLRPGLMGEEKQQAALRRLRDRGIAGAVFAQVGKDSFAALPEPFFDLVGCHLIFLARRRRCREKNQFFKGVENSIVRPWHQGRSAQLSSAAGDRSGRQSVQSRWRLRKGRAGRCRVCSWRPGGYWIGMRFGCLCEARFYGGFGPA